LHRGILKTQPPKELIPVYVEAQLLAQALADICRIGVPATDWEPGFENDHGVFTERDARIKSAAKSFELLAEANRVLSKATYVTSASAQGEVVRARLQALLDEISGAAEAIKAKKKAAILQHHYGPDGKIPPGYENCGAYCHGLPDGFHEASCPYLPPPLGRPMKDTIAESILEEKKKDTEPIPPLSDAEFLVLKKLEEPVSGNEEWRKQLVERVTYYYREADGMKHDAPSGIAFIRKAEDAQRAVDAYDALAKKMKGVEPVMEQ
jgi:cytochrome c1